MNEHTNATTGQRTQIYAIFPQTYVPMGHYSNTHIWEIRRSKCTILLQYSIYVLYCIYIWAKINERIENGKNNIYQTQINKRLAFGTCKFTISIYILQFQLNFTNLPIHTTSLYFVMKAMGRPLRWIFLPCFNLIDGNLTLYTHITSAIMIMVASSCMWTWTVSLRIVAFLVVVTANRVW